MKSIKKEKEYKIFKILKNDSINIKKANKYIIYSIFVLLLFFSFYKNIFAINLNQRNFFYTFQKDSESLVIGSIITDKYKLNNTLFGLQGIKELPTENYEEYKRLLEDSNNTRETVDYKSQIGMQGRIFSFLYNKLHIPINILNMITAFILAIVLVNICRLLREKYGRLLALTFYITFLLSPWIVSFARNLYWVSFTWFLPLMFCLLLNKTKNIKLYVPMIFLSVFFKCLCGYEYLSTILLTTISFMFVDFCINKNERKQILKLIFIVGSVSILAFSIVMCIHGAIRENGNILYGIEKIIEEDVMRGTISTNTDQFEDPSIKTSIKATYWEVIKKYFNFNTDILIGIDGSLFVIMSIFAVVICLHKLRLTRENSIRDCSLYIISLISTLSWLILGKAHSYIHTHMNYVLWYFGYVQITLYIILRVVFDKIKKYKNERK